MTHTHFRGLIIIIFKILMMMMIMIIIIIINFVIKQYTQTEKLEQIGQIYV